MRQLIGHHAGALSQIPILLVAGCLITVSCLFSVSFGYRLGEASGTQWLFALFSLGVEGFAVLSLPLLWSRLRIFSRILLLGFFSLCLAYKLTAAHRFAAENLGQRESARTRMLTDYSHAEQRVRDLRERLTLYAEARSGSVIQAEIDALLRDPHTDGCQGPLNGPVTRQICPKVDKLRAEAAKAQAFEQVQADLQIALARLNGKTPVAAVTAEASGPVPWLLALFGWPAGSFADFVANLVMMLVEAGSVIVPMLAGSARRSQAPLEPEALPRSSLPLEIKAPALPTRTISDKTRRDAAQLRRFLQCRTETATGQQVQSTTLYLIYSDWVQGQKERPMSINQFGNLLTHHLHVSKVKRGGKHWYGDLRLKSLGSNRKAITRKAAPCK